MRALGYAGCIMLLGGSVVFAEDLVIDDFNYPNDAAAQQAWKPIDPTPPVTVQPRPAPAKGNALRLSCPFTREMDRSYCDRAVNLNLSRFGRFTLEFYVDNPAACRGFTLYFRSGQGWYGAGFTGEAGWQTITLAKAQFGSEDSPAGWDKIDGVRLAQWKGGAADTYVCLADFVAHSSEVAVILSTTSMKQAASEAQAVEQYDKRMQLLLEKAGISADLVSDEDVLGGALEGRKLAIFAYSPVLAPEVLRQAQQFVGGGGKVFACYSLDAGMADLLGIRATGYKRAEPAGEFAAIAFEAAGIEGLPAKVRQDSWNVTLIAPAREDAKVIGWWEDDKGQRSADAAMTLSKTGLFLGHVLTDADEETKEQMMAALIGHFLPDVWVRRAQQAIAGVPRVGPFTTVDDLRAFITANAARTERAEKAKALLAEADGSLKAAQASVEGGAAPKATEQAGQAHAALKEAYVICHAPRDGEFRALWEHSGSGAYPEEGWATSIDRIAAAGFNAIVPNMWWAGLAQYDSAYLPHSKAFQEHGDQIAQCLAAAHARGVQVHAWKVNWNLGNAPPEFVQKLRAAGRTMVSATGEPVDWLCPSNPENFQLELDTMLEVVKKYDVDGVHFDYIRYLDDSVCYCDGCRQRFEAAAGLKVEHWPADCYNGPLHDKYRDFRCDQITRLVRATSEQAHQLKPYLKVSAAVFSDYPGCRTYVGQDWVKWVQEGYLDFVCPMDYTDSNAGFRRTVARQLAQIGGRIPFYPGIGASAPGLPADQVIAQADIARELGADGFIVFALTRTTAEDHVPAMGRGLTSKPTFLPHEAPKIVFELPGDADPGDGAVHPSRKQALTVKVRFVSLGAFRREVKGVTAAIELQTAGGTPIEKLAQFPDRVGQEVSVTIQPHADRLRVVVTGKLSFADGSEQPFVVRSLPFVFDRD